MTLQVDKYLHAPFVLTLQVPTSRRVLGHSLGGFTLADEGIEGLQSLEDCGVIFYIHFEGHCASRQMCLCIYTYIHACIKVRRHQ